MNSSEKSIAGRKSIRGGARFGSIRAARTVTFACNHYDQAVAIAAACLLITSACYVAKEFFHQAARVSALQIVPRLRKAGPLEQAARLAEALRELDRPVQWNFAGPSGLFVPEKHFIGSSGLPISLRATEVHPPVPNSWFDQFDLPIAEIDVLAQDPDGDGFSNFDEWHALTDPTDRNSHPEFLTKFRMKSFERQVFDLIFASRVGDTYAINSIDLKVPTQFVRLGQTIPGTSFRIIRFTEKLDRNQYGTDVDASELTLERQDGGEQLTLVKEKMAMSPESVGHFIYLWGGSREFQLKKGEEFALPPNSEIKYRLIDLQPDRAVIKSLQRPGQRTEILRSER